MQTESLGNKMQEMRKKKVELETIKAKQEEQRLQKVKKGTENYRNQQKIINLEIKTAAQSEDIKQLKSQLNAVQKQNLEDGLQVKTRMQLDTEQLEQKQKQYRGYTEDELKINAFRYCSGGKQNYEQERHIQKVTGNLGDA
ncbi:Hypothetical_protein [Hexamita inflata]|uniref:Hypothetical_protein n=1 Tax=Hexamita inflata TaxID=28002 RepID=A0AA86NMV9_9EUKA|nr:Hypothetical protein HINF_LOCUS10887 [Hexamita inflata]